MQNCRLEDTEGAARYDLGCTAQAAIVPVHGKCLVKNKSSNGPTL